MTDWPDHPPLFEAQHSLRYERQSMIREYQERYQCRLVVLRAGIAPWLISYLEEAVYDANPEEDLHVVLQTMGGDGETAIRMLRQVQSRCRELTVIVPDQAKSAGTLFALGAHRILMGPMSDLGPIDPQMMIGGEFHSAKAMIAAVEDAETRISEAPDTYPLHVALLEQVSALTVQSARDAIAHTGDQLKEALAACTGRKPEDVEKLADTLRLTP